MKKIYKGLPTSWTMMAFHKPCRDLISVPANNTDFLTSFTHFCPKCGSQYKSYELETFTGRFISAAKWFNPLSWFDVYLEETKN